MRRNEELLWLLIRDPFGLTGLLLMLLALTNLFLYGVNLPENPEPWNYWIAWLYPIVFALLGPIFLYLATHNIYRRSREFLRAIAVERKRLLEAIKNIDTMKIDAIPSSSEFGINNVDIEILEIIKESGGYVPLIFRDLEEAPFSNEQVRRSVAKLWVLDYINVPTEVKSKIVLTPRGLDALHLPHITFATRIPEDISLMLIHANALYREGDFYKVILRCYSTLERALKMHLIPAIDDYQEKWNEKVDKKLANVPENERKKYYWNGVKTIASLNDLWNFYRKNTGLSRKWRELGERVVKYTAEEKKRIEEMERIVNKSVDVVADVRSTYAHDKPTKKYEKDAYRVLKLTELVVGMMFEDFKNQFAGE
ncbi:MAG: hypothetical protein GXO25_07490 [Euryarchaeota archaeon]|nr:hypothetical protein [Euryarchaeota archaeon]